MDTLPDTLLVPKGYTVFDILHGVQAQPLVNTLPDTLAKADSRLPCDTLRHVDAKSLIHTPD